jgi:hypothetical protein
MYFKAAWNDYFTGSPTLQQSNEYGTRQRLSGTNVHILNCLFRSINSGSNGGAVYSYNSVTCLLIESSSFLSCKTSDNNGGVIYFYYSGGQCVLDKVCGYDCCSNLHYEFAYLHLSSDSISLKNYVNYSSIVRCVNENSNSNHVLGLFLWKNLLSIS